MPWMADGCTGSSHRQHMGCSTVACQRAPRSPGGTYKTESRKLLSKIFAGSSVMRLFCNPLVVSREHGRAGTASQNALVSSRHRLARREAHARELGESLGPHPVDTHRQGVRHTCTTWPLAAALARTHPSKPPRCLQREGGGAVEPCPTMGARAAQQARTVSRARRCCQKSSPGAP